MGNKFAFIEFTVAGIAGNANNRKPFSLESVNIAGESGYKVRLPITEDDARINKDFTIDILEKTVEELRNYEVEIILPPNNVQLPFVKTIPVASGDLLFPFFLTKCVRRICKKNNGSRDISHINALLAGGPAKLTELTINCLARELNYVSIVIDDNMKRSEKEWLAGLTDSLLFETGVPICTLENSGAAYKNADVIINLKKSAGRFESVYRENAIFADLSRNEERMWEITRRRPDVIAFDGIRLRLSSAKRSDIMTLPVFELFFFVKNPDYQRLAVSADLDYAAMDRVYNALERMNVQISALYRKNKVIVF